MALKTANNVATTLAADLAAGGTSMTLASAVGFPTLTGSDYQYATLESGSVREVVKVTARTGTVCTIDACTLSWSSGAKVEIRLVSEAVDDLQKLIPSETLAQGDILYYNGSAWKNLGYGTSGYSLKTQGASANPVWGASGKIIQVQGNSYSTYTTTTNTAFQPTGLSQAITPSSASNKIIAIASMHASQSYAGSVTASYYALFRDAVNIQDKYISSGTQSNSLGISFAMQDSPASTSSVTYSLKMRSDTSSTLTKAQLSSYPSSLVLMEVLA